MAANPKITGDTISIERPSSRAQLDEFARLPFQVYRARDAWWPPDVQNEIDLLSRRSLLSTHLEITPFSVRRGGMLVARVSAVINRRYIEHWNEQLGQLIQFEALEGEDVAVAAMLDEAVNSLRERGMRAVRSGFAAFLDYPYAIDNYDSLPSFLLRGNPASYHRYFKEAGFVTEKGQVDYTAPLTPRSSRAIAGWPRRPPRPTLRFRAGASTGFLPRLMRGPTLPTLRSIVIGDGIR